LLQLGAKYYGVHLGPATVPQEESDPRVLLEPNFYYPQEDLLKAFCARHDGCGWNTTRPSWIPGAVRDAAMNIVHPLAVYATVQKHLGQPLIFPADLNCWEVLVTFSTAMLNCHLAEWAVLTKGTANESFNAVDGCSFAWGKFWPKLAAHFDMPWTGPDTEPDAHYREMTTPYSPPPRGWGPPGTTRYKFTFTEWARRDEVTAAWREVAEKNNIANKELVDPDRIFGFLDACILGTCPVVLSEVKLRKHGFFGFVDSAESILHVIGELAEIGMIPKV
jgi:hypothetical protein